MPTQSTLEAARHEFETLAIGGVITSLDDIATFADKRLLDELRELELRARREYIWDDVRQRISILEAALLTSGRTSEVKTDGQ